jgi:hypothetical protein
MVSADYSGERRRSEYFDGAMRKLVGRHLDMCCEIVVEVEYLHHPK